MKPKVAELNRRLAESEKKLTRARKMEALGLMAGGVAHDLNNILSSIVGYPELLLMDDNLTREQEIAIEAIRDSGLRASAVIEDLLTVTRGVASVMEPLNLNSIIKEYLLSPEHQQIVQYSPLVAIETDLSPDLFNLKGSTVHIAKTLLNLVVNAVEAVLDKKDGKVIIKTKNRYLDRALKGYNDVRIGEYVLLTVSDNGGGISDQDRERIFEPFYAKKDHGKKRNRVSD